MMTFGNIEIKKWQDNGFFCAQIIFRMTEPTLIEKRFISAKSKADFDREIEWVLHSTFDSVLH